MQLSALEKLVLSNIASASEQVEVFLDAATAETSRCKLTLEVLFIDNVVLAV